MKETSSLNGRGQGWCALFFSLVVAAVLLFAILTLPFGSRVSAEDVDRSVDKLGRSQIIATGSFTSFLPLAYKAPPVPRVMAAVSLPGAQCPNAVEANPVSGYVYVANRYSNNVNVLSGTTVLATVATGAEPTSFASDPHSVRTYLTNLLAGTVSAFEGTTLVENMSVGPEPFAINVNPINHLIYVTNLLGQIKVVQNSQVVATIQYSNWPLFVTSHPHSGLTYSGDWMRGHLIAISDTQQIAQFDVCWGPRRMVVDPITGLIYVACQNPISSLPHNLAIVSDTQVIKTFQTWSGAYDSVSGSNDIAIDPAGGYVYAINSENDNVTVLRGTELVGILGVGRQPWAVAVNPNTGFAFVVNRGSDNVTILRDGIIMATLPTGDEPFAVAVNTLNDYVYVVNRASEEVCDAYNLCHWECHPTTVTILW